MKAMRATMRATALVAALAAVVWVNPASAWDSAGADFHLRTHVPPRTEINLFGTVPSDTAHPNDIRLGPGVHYAVQIQRHALGLGSPQDGVVTNMMRCPPSAITSTGLDLHGCTPLSAQDEPLNNFGWVKVRRRWDLEPPSEAADAGHGAEHAKLAAIAVEMAGLSELELFKKPFWVRYPGYAGFVASPISAAADGAPDDMIVSPSWIPASFGASTGQVVRGISLVELAQMPDVSNTVWDWAAGNELCPVAADLARDGVDIFGGSVDGKPDRRYDAHACHDFARLMGPINASHFPPLARAFYAHYHRLAVERMEQCKALQPVLGWYSSLDAEWEAGLKGLARRTWSSKDTEVHACEREAFVYEMFAQHFLQDTWATGHMWRRWGSTRLSDFPASAGPGLVRLTGIDPETYMPSGTVEFPDKEEKDIPSKNVQGRRYILAAMAAAYSGTVHGARAVSATIAREEITFFHSHDNKAWSRLSSALASGFDKYLDDPLSAPLYHWPWETTSPERDVAWTATGGIFTGLGDMFVGPSSTLNPTRSPRRLLAPFPELDEQRRRLLACSASSFLEVYDAGPKTHGAPAAVRDPYMTGWTRIPDVIHASTCWEQRATNASMFGSVGPLHLRRVYKLNAAGVPEPDKESSSVEKFNAYVNTVLLAKVQEGVVLPDVEDRRAFLISLGQRIPEFHSWLTTAFAANAHPSAALEPVPTGEPAKGPNGTASSELRFAGSPLSFLTIPRNPDVPDGTDPAPFVDRLAPLAGDDYVAPDQYVPRMFWRGHLTDLCLGRPPPPSETPSSPAEPHSPGGATGETPFEPPSAGGGAPGGGGASDDVGLGASHLESLRDRCIAAAKHGGDPAACTACVMLAEPNIPTCRRVATTTDSGMSPSKCQLLGRKDTGGLPPEWFDRDARLFSANEVDCGFPPFEVAVTYCTGTTAQRGEFHTESVRKKLLEAHAVRKSLCRKTHPYEHDEAGQPKDVTPYLGEATYRVAAVHHEAPWSGTVSDAQIPVVSAIEVTYTDHELVETTAEGGEICHPYTTHNRDAWISGLDRDLSGFPEWNPASTSGFKTRLRTTQDEGLLFPSWGPSQRLTFWNRTCSAAKDAVGAALDFRGLRADVDPVTGYFATEFALSTVVSGEPDMRCALAEPFRFTARCPPFAIPTNDGTCSFGLYSKFAASGLDETAFRPAVERVDAPPSPAAVVDACLQYRSRIGLDVDKVDVVATTPAGHRVYLEKNRSAEANELRVAIVAADAENDDVYLAPVRLTPAVDALLGEKSQCRPLQFKSVKGDVGRLINRANDALDAAVRFFYRGVHVFVELPAATPEDALARWRSTTATARPKDFKQGFVTAVRVLCKEDASGKRPLVDMPLHETPIGGP